MTPGASRDPALVRLAVVGVAILGLVLVTHALHLRFGDLALNALLLTQGLPPEKRPRLRLNGAAPNQFWRFVP